MNLVKLWDTKKWLSRRTGLALTIAGFAFNDVFTVVVMS